jgi:hypothetical protein
MARRKIPTDVGMAAVHSVQAGSERVNSNPEFATAVRFLLEDLAIRIPGNSVEVRVPPLGAVQCVPGPQHRRGTPANVVELSPQTWFALATGELDIDAALESAAVIASGVRATEFAVVLPLTR